LLIGLLVSPAPLASGQTLDRSLPEIGRSLALRERYGVAVPEAREIIHIDSVAVHHTRLEWSVIAWRDAVGLWRISAVGEDGPGGLLPIERRLLPETISTLPARHGRALDRLLRSSALYREPVRRTGDIGIGAPFHVMQIVTPAGRTIVRWDGRLRGRTGHVADIVLGHD
jgi:hypothetical protein